MERQYPGDLRNRVVGARLIHDGKLPYTYTWQVGDSIRYYDFNNISSGQGISNITASPFFHQLFQPLFELPQRTISQVWLWLQYFLLIVMVVMICALTTDKNVQWLIINIGVLFTATEAWKFLIASGQLYLFVGFLICLILYGLLINKKLFLILSAFITTIFILIRPIGIVVFIPFLFYYKRFPVYLGVSLSLLGIYGLFILTNTNQKTLYRDYFNGLRLHVKDYEETEFESKNIPLQHSYYYTVVEGFGIEEMYRSFKEHPIKIYSENGNILVLYYKTTHRKMSMSVLNGLLAATIFFLSLPFFFVHRKQPPGNLQIILFGLILYLIIEFFTPVNRHQYYTVQWLPLVLASLLVVTARLNIVFILLVAGLLFNICNWDWLFMRHTIGEFCWFAAILVLVFSSSYNYPSWKKQS